MFTSNELPFNDLQLPQNSTSRRTQDRDQAKAGLCPMGSPELAQSAQGDSGLLCSERMTFMTTVEVALCWLYLT